MDEHLHRARKMLRAGRLALRCTAGSRAGDTSVWRPRRIAAVEERGADEDHRQRDELAAESR